MKEKLTILVVEDNLLNQKVVSFNLKRQGYEVIVAQDGAEGVERFRETKFDAILMDIMMPIMDGMEATSKIRELEELDKSLGRTPIIALTANTMDNDRDKCIAGGMDDFMTKPFDIEKLFSIFNELGIL